MTILFWVLFIGGPFILGLVFSPPGPGYILTLFLHYPVWFGLKLLSDFTNRKTEIDESYILFAAILIGLVFSMKFYQMGGEGEPFKEAKAFGQIIFTPKSITQTDKYQFSTAEGRLRRSAALGKYSNNKPDLELPVSLSTPDYRIAKIYYVERFDDELESDLPNFKYESVEDDFIISFELRGKDREVLLSKILRDRIEFEDGYSIKDYQYYDFGSGLSYILYYYFKLIN